MVCYSGTGLFSPILMICEENEMLDFIIDLAVEIGEFFAELWVNKIVGRIKKKKEKSGEQAH